MSRYLTFAAAIFAGSALGDDASPFRIATRRSDDRVAVDFAEGRATVSIVSPFGIGSAAIELREPTWPETTLRLRLKGLERFSVSNGRAKVEASVSVRDGKPATRIWKDGVENAPLDAKSPYWLEIRTLGGDAGFEIRLPRAIFDGKPKSIAIEWIDFYRN